MKLLVFLFMFVPVISFAQLGGDWYSTFTVMGTAINIKMNVVDSEPTMISLTDLDGKFEDVKVENHSIKNNAITFSWDAIGLAFEGDYKEAENEITGVMSQSGLKWDVTFTKEQQESVVINRPQEPQAPFDYVIEELTIKNKEISLGATLTLPKDFSETSAIVVLASGSGPQDRDCEIMGHKPFWVIADYLANNGIACLRFDDRSVGKSTGVFSEASMDDFGSDVIACVNHLRKKKKFKKNRIGIAGHSEGGAHALIAARDGKKIDFIIELASIGGSAADVLIEQQYLIPIQGGDSEENAKWNQETYKGIVRILREEDDPTEAMTTFLGEHYDKAPEEIKENTNRASFILGQSVMFNNDWGKSFCEFDAQDYLKEIDLPILAINGEKDIQVPAESNSAGFKKYENATCHILPGLNHLMQTCESCNMTEYGELEETFSEDVMKIMVEWIKNQLP